MLTIRPPWGEDENVISSPAKARWRLVALACLLQGLTPWPDRPAGHQVARYQCQQGGTSGSRRQGGLGAIGEETEVIQLIGLGALLAVAVGFRLQPCQLGGTQLRGVERFAAAAVAPLDRLDDVAGGELPESFPAGVGVGRVEVSELPIELSPVGSG